MDKLPGVGEIQKNEEIVPPLPDVWYKPDDPSWWHFQRVAARGNMREKCNGRLTVADVIRIRSRIEKRATRMFYYRDEDGFMRSTYDKQLALKYLEVE